MNYQNWESNIYIYVVYIYIIIVYIWYIVYIVYIMGLNLITNNGNNHRVICHQVDMLMWLGSENWIPTFMDPWESLWEVVVPKFGTDISDVFLHVKKRISFYM